MKSGKQKANKNKSPPEGDSSRLFKKTNNMKKN